MIHWLQQPTSCTRFERSKTCVECKRKRAESITDSQPCAWPSTSNKSYASPAFMCTLCHTTFHRNVDGMLTMSSERIHASDHTWDVSERALRCVVLPFNAILLYSFCIQHLHVTTFLRYQAPWLRDSQRTSPQWTTSKCSSSLGGTCPVHVSNSSHCVTWRRLSLHCYTQTEALTESVSQHPFKEWA